MIRRPRPENSRPRCSKTRRPQRTSPTSRRLRSARTKSTAPGFVAASLIHDLENPRHFVSFASWSSPAARSAWQQHAEYAARIGACRAMCDARAAFTSSQPESNRAGHPAPTRTRLGLG
ncbi:antibiotic biosynthesis monooxygenase [Nocardia sp. NBC_00403]|uniref:antibiotic biosynthesis monooxygenase n=1 Tax=Nocardia sp. NBC_00403 TaxID=2975990 RepID=UPI003FA5A2A2